MYKISLLMVFAFCFSALSENVLLNSDFEKINTKSKNLPYAWGYFPRNKFGSVDSQTAASGKNSICFNVPLGKEKACGFHQSRKVRIPANTPLKLSLWHKNSKLSYPKNKRPSWGVSMAIQFADGSKKYPGLGIGRSSTWNYHERVLKYPKEITAIKYIYLKDYNTSGQMWYDDIYFGPWSESDKYEAAVPRVTIPNISSAPKLDGKLDDTCWQKAAKLGKFTVYSKNQFAKNKTEVYLAQDKDNLYIATRSYSKVLDPALQMLDKFAAKETEHDGHVFRDDSIELFIAPDGHNYYQFAYNALGTRYEGCKKEKSWNGNWKVKTSRNTKSWDAEIVIPLKQLNIKGRFKFNICRNEQFEKEYSTWAPVETGYHDFNRFGIAYSGQKTLQAFSSNLPIGLVDLGIHNIDFKIKNYNLQKQKIRLAIQLFHQASGSMSMNEVELSPGEQQESQLRINLEKSGSYQYRYLLTDLNNGKLLYQSPLYQITSKAILKAENKISFPGKVQLSINGNPVKKKTFFLQKGPNIITADFIGNGTIKGGISLNNKEKGLPEVIEFKGTCKDKLTLKKTILINSTKIYPIDTTNGLHLEKDANQHLPFVVKNPDGKKLEILLPSPMSAVDWQDNNTIKYAQTEYKSLTAINKTVNGLKYKLYRYDITCPKKIKKLVLGFMASLPRNTPEKISPVYFRVSGTNITEAWQKVPVKIMPALTRKRPKKIRIELCHGFGVGNYTPSQIAALVKTFSSTGFNSFYERVLCYDSNAWLKPLRNNKMNVVTEIHQVHQLAPLFRKYPQNRAKNFAGKTPAHQRLKLPFIYGKGREEVKQIISQYVKKYKPDEVIIDLEASPFKECDTSNETMKEFAKFAKLSTIPTPEEVKKDYAKQWIDFMCIQWAKVGQVYKEGVKIGSPQAKFGVYSSYQTPRNKAHYAMDWNYWKGIVDFAEMGYGRQTEKIRKATFEALKGVPVYTGILYWQQTPTAVAKILKNKILRRITDGANGIMLYTWVKLDGIARTQINKAATIIADHEELFLTNKKSREFKTTGNISQDSVVLLSGKNQYLLLVFNNHSRILNGKIDLKVTDDYYTTINGKTFSGKNIPVSVRPYDTGVFYFTRKPKSIKQ